jgi:hypothetical protein
MLRSGLLAIVLTGLTALSVGAPVAQAHGWDRCNSSAYRRYVARRRLANLRFVATRRVYSRARPDYVYVRRYYPRVVRTYPYRSVRLVAYGRTCY